MVKVVSFDVWNTLLRLEVVYERLAETLAPILKMEKDKVLEKILEAYNEAKRARRLGKLKASEILKSSREIMASKLGIDLKLLPNIIAKAMASIKSEEIVIDEVPKVLEDIKNLGLKIVTLGNVLFWPSTLTRKLLDSAGISRFFDAQFYSDELGVHKPDGKAFLMICKVLNVEPEEVLHVGDGIAEDLGGALTVGFKAVLISGHVSEPISIGDNIHIIPHIRHLTHVIKNLRR